MSKEHMPKTIVHRKTFRSESPTLAETLGKGEESEFKRQTIHPALEMDDDGRAFCCLQGQLTSNDWHLPFFADKAVEFSGLNIMKHLSMGIVCHRGKKPDMCNQDDFFFLASGGTLMYGVMDGHGKDGDRISHFVQTHLPELLLSDGLEALVAEDVDVEEKITKAFTKTQELLESELPRRCKHSGCTATLVIQCPKQGKLWAANVGDSTAVIARRPKGHKCPFNVEKLTVDHKPNLPGEKERIEAAGGWVIEPEMPTAPSRLMTPHAGYAMSRSLGDSAASQYGLSCSPEIHVHDISDHSEEYFILVCSDGVWEFLDAFHVVQMCSKYDSSNAQKAAEKLAHKAQLRWQERGSVVDDITVLLVHGGYDVELLSNAAEEDSLTVGEVSLYCSQKFSQTQVGEAQAWRRVHEYLKVRLAQHQRETYTPEPC